jgi:hypothetical protein
MSDTGVTSDTSADVATEVGLKNEVSKEKSRPSGMAALRIEGDARKTEDSYERSVSGAQIDSGIVGLDIVGCSTVDGTVSDGVEGDGTGTGSSGTGGSESDGSVSDGSDIDGSDKETSSLIVGVTEDSVGLDMVNDVRGVGITNDS